MKKISLILRSLEKSQKTIVLKNQIEKSDLDITLFTMDRSHNDIYIQRSCMPITNIYSNWDNILVATNFDEALFVSSVPTNSERVLYIWDLNWNQCGLSYDILKKCVSTFNKVFCRSMSHKKMIDAHFNIESMVVKNFNLKEIFYGTDNG